MKHRSFVFHFRVRANSSACDNNVSISMGDMSQMLRDAERQIARLKREQVSMNHHFEGSRRDVMVLQVSSCSPKTQTNLQRKLLQVPTSPKVWTKCNKIIKLRKILFLEYNAGSKNFCKNKNLMIFREDHQYVFNFEIRYFFEDSLTPLHLPLLSKLALH